MKKTLVLLIVVLLVMTGCSGKETPEEDGEKVTNEESTSGWKTGEKLEKELKSKIYNQKKPSTDLYIDFSEDDLVVSPDKEETEIEIEELLIYRPSRIYYTHLLPDITDEKNEKDYNELKMGDKKFADYLEKSENLTIELEDENHRIFGYEAVAETEEDSEDITALYLQPERKEYMDFEKLVGESGFQQMILDSGLEIEKTKVYRVDQVGIFDIYGLLITDGDLEFFYVDNVFYFRNETENLDSSEINLDSGLYPTVVVLDLMLEEADTLRAYAEETGELPETSLSQENPIWTNENAEGGITSDTEEVDTEDDVGEELETDDTPEDAQTTDDLDIAPPFNEDSSSGQALSNPGLPEGETDGVIIE